MIPAPVSPLALVNPPSSSECKTDGKKCKVPSSSLSSPSRMEPALCKLALFLLFLFCWETFFSFQILFSCLGGDVNFSKFFFTTRKGEGNLTGGAGRMHLGEREARGECFLGSHPERSAKSLGLPTPPAPAVGQRETQKRLVAAHLSVRGWKSATCTPHHPGFIPISAHSGDQCHPRAG